MNNFIAVNKKNDKILGKMTCKGLVKNEPNILFKVTIGDFSGNFEDLYEETFIDMVSMILKIKRKNIELRKI